MGSIKVTLALYDISFFNNLNLPFTDADFTVLAVFPVLRQILVITQPCEYTIVLQDMLEASMLQKILK